MYHWFAIMKVFKRIMLAVDELRELDTPELFLKFIIDLIHFLVYLLV